MHLTCTMFLIYCFDVSKSYNDFSFQKNHIVKTKIIKTTEKEPYKWIGGDDGSVLHYILGTKHVNCTSALLR